MESTQEQVEATNLIAWLKNHGVTFSSLTAFIHINHVNTQYQFIRSEIPTMNCMGKKKKKERKALRLKFLSAVLDYLVPLIPDFNPALDAEW